MSTSVDYFNLDEFISTDFTTDEPCQPIEQELQKPAELKYQPLNLDNLNYISSLGQDLAYTTTPATTLSPSAISNSVKNSSPVSQDAFGLNTTAASTNDMNFDDASIFLDIEDILSSDNLQLENSNAGFSSNANINNGVSQAMPQIASNSNVEGFSFDNTYSYNYAVNNHSMNDNVNNHSQMHLSSPTAKRHHGLILSNQLPITPEDSPRFYDNTNTPASHSATLSPAQHQQQQLQAQQSIQLSLSSSRSTTPQLTRSRQSSEVTITKENKRCLNSRLSVNSLSQVLSLPLQETMMLEKYVLDRFTKDLKFPLGHKTWIRDTNGTQRQALLVQLYNLCTHQYPDILTLENLEIIIKRATYSCMQGRLRKERRAASVSRKTAKKSETGKSSSL